MLSAASPIRATRRKSSIRRVKDQPGVSAAIFGPLAEADISVDMIVQNISADGAFADITFTVARKDLRKALEVLNGVKDKIGFDDIVHSADVAKVSIVGIGMRSHAGVAAKMFRSLAEKGINIQAITTSEIKVERADRRGLYRTRGARPAHRLWTGRQGRLNRCA